MYSDGADDEIHQQATWQHAEVQCISAEHRNGPLLPDRRENYSDEDDHDDADTNQPIDYPTHELKFVVPYVKSVDVCQFTANYFEKIRV